LSTFFFCGIATGKLDSLPPPNAEEEAKAQEGKRRRKKGKNKAFLNLPVSVSFSA